MKPIDFVIPNISTPKGQIILYDLPLVPFTVYCYLHGQACERSARYPILSHGRRIISLFS